MIASETKVSKYQKSKKNRALCSIGELVFQIRIVGRTDESLHGKSANDIFCMRNLYAAHMSAHLKQIQINLINSDDELIKEHIKILVSTIEDDRVKIFRPYGEP